MSIHVMAAVWDRSAAKGTDLLVQLALADNADQERSLAWPSIDLLAAKTRVDRRTVQRCLRRLEHQGEIKLVRHGGRTPEGCRTAVYRVTPGQGRHDVTHDPPRAATTTSMGDTSAAPWVTPAPPQPSIEPSTGNVSISGERAGARAGKQAISVSHRGQKASREQVDLASRLLIDFNEKTGRKLQLVDGRGRASAALKQIVGAVLSRPDVSRDDWFRAVANTCKAPPAWVDGPLQIGHVFGERAVEHALVNTGVPASRRNSATPASPGATAPMETPRSEWRYMRED